MDINMDELRSRRDHINAVTSRMVWNPPDETGCDITCHGGPGAFGIVGAVNTSKTA